MKTISHFLIAGICLVRPVTGLAQPAITTQPQSQTNVAGTTATFTVAATGTSPLAYQWQRDTGFLDFYDFADRTNAVLVLTNVGAGDAVNNRVVVTNIEGSVTSAVAHLTVLVPPRITQLINVYPSVSLGAQQALRVTASGTPSLYVQWVKDSAALSGQTSYLLNFPSVQATNLGFYSVVATNAAGAVTSNPVRLDVDPTFTKITTGPPVTDVGDTRYGCWGDYDGDGYPDLFVARIGRSALYHNNRDGTFTSITNAPFLQTGQDWRKGAWADLDNDGRPDLVVARAFEPAIVYFNNGDGTFSPVQLAEAWPGNLAVLDYNQDGLLDVLLGGSANGGDWQSPAPSWLYRNNGDRTFARLTSTELGPIANFAADTAICADYDDDGRVDVFCGNYMGSSQLFRNDGTGRFVSDTNVVFQSLVPTGAWGDYDNDGRVDLCAVGHGGSTFVYRNLGGGKFERAGIGQTIQGIYSSASWADYDNDGFLDLFLTSGDGDPNALYHNNGDGTFTRITTGSLANNVPAWALAGLWFDYDNDGFLDLYMCNWPANGSATSVNFLYHNNGNSNAWLKVKLIGTASNRDAVGAKVRVQAQYAGQVRWQRRDISGGDALSGNQLYAHFGLGDATNVTTLRIEWPSGIVQELKNLPVKQSLTVTEPAKLSMPRAGELHIQCWKNMVFDVLTSTNLVAWTRQATVTNLNLKGGVQWTDPDAPGQSTRFYRAVKQ